MVECPHPECSDSDKKFESDATMRQHHTKVHGEQLPNSECKNCGDKFFRKSGGTYCDDCKNERYKGSNNPAYKGKIDYIRSIKKRATCSEMGCNESRSAALCFHHKQEHEKIANISRMAVTAEYSLEELKEEVKKCVVICQNCHKDKHANTEQEHIENYTINWEDYNETDMEIDGYRVFTDENSRKYIIRTCEYCNQEFLAQARDYKRGYGKFHSIKCSNRYHKTERTDSKLGLVRTLKKEGECSSKDCNESRPHCLQFHHIEKEDKRHSIQQIIESGNIEDLRSELNKCELLCANCHEVEHSTTN